MRPTSVTVVSWLIIVFNAFGLFGAVNSYRQIESGEYERLIQSDPRVAAMVKDMPKPNKTLILASSVCVLVELIGGILTLTGRGIGRILYLGGVGVAVLLAIAFGTPIVWVIPAIVIAGIFAFFLYRPAANAYFAANA